MQDDRGDACLSSDDASAFDGGLTNLKDELEWDLGDLPKGSAAWRVELDHVCAACVARSVTPLERLGDIFKLAMQELTAQSFGSDEETEALAVGKERAIELEEMVAELRAEFDGARTTVVGRRKSLGRYANRSPLCMWRSLKPRRRYESSPRSFVH